MLKGVRQRSILSDSVPVTGPISHLFIIEPVLDAVLRGQEACQQGGACRRAHAVDGKRASEAQTFICELIDIGGPNVRVPIGSQNRGRLIVDDNE